LTITKTKFLLGTTAASLCLAASVASAASHREAPGISEQPKIDATDFYMFRSYEEGRGEYVTFIANYQPLQAPYGGPNYFTMDPDALYEIHVDNDGDAIEDISFQFQFDNSLDGGTGLQLDIFGEMVSIPLRAAGGIQKDGTGNGNAFLFEDETYSLNIVNGDRRSGDVMALSHDGGTVFTKPADYFGQKTFPDYAAYAEQYIYDNVSLPNCSTPARVFSGQRAEGFAVNLGEVFDLVNLVPIQGNSSQDWPQYDSNTPFNGGIVQDRANDDLIGESNITSLAIEVPIECLTGEGNGVIGAWTTASLPQAELEDPSPTYEATSEFGGAWVQQSRLSAPLVNELVIGLPDKDLFNAAEPRQDSALAIYVTNPTLPALVNILFNSNKEFGVENIAPSNVGRSDLAAAFLTGLPGFNQQATVTGSEMMRLNTAVPATPKDSQHTFGVIAEDLAGFPNGRRPGDDVVDIALRVVMGALCHPVPLGAELTGNPAIEDTADDNINLGFCDPDKAPAGTTAFTDGAPLNASEFSDTFPYLNTPLPGARSPT
jgi:hypothetical protein